MTHQTETSGEPKRAHSRGAAEFSVVIPARNEERMIGRCFENLAAMSFPASAFEVVVVDNGSTDRTAEIADSWKDRLQVRVVTKPDGHNSALRNFGAAEATGAFLAFLDADCLVPRDWLRFGVRLLSARGAGVVGAHCRIPADSSWVAKVWHDDRLADSRGKTSYVPTGDMLMRRETFQKVGGFDESLETNEDYEFCQRARKAGFPVLSFPELGVIHLGTPQTLAAFYRQSRWHGRHVFRVFLSSLPSLRNVRPVLFATYMLLAIIGVFAGAGLAIVSGRTNGLLEALGVALAGPLVLAIHRACKRRKGQALAPLVLLFLVYGVARAACLLPWSAWMRSKGHRRQESASAGYDVSNSVEGIRRP
jgi:cellulose synthase/poly-beta-1,6-N-acetylglucosamine synthase-like glycosyltransferase